MREQAMSIRAAFAEGSLESAIPDPPPMSGDDPADEGWESERWWPDEPDQEE